MKRYKTSKCKKFNIKNLFLLNFFFLLLLGVFHCKCQNNSLFKQAKLQHFSGKSVANVHPLNNQRYFDGVSSLILSAQHTIDVMLYQIRYYNAYPGSKSNRLIEALIKAKKRGVTVRMLIEVSDWNPDNSFNNYFAGSVLNKYGVIIAYDSPNINTHDKMIIIDHSSVVIGSSNWSHFSLERNNEANVFIASKAVAIAETDYFNSLFKNSSSRFPLNFPSLLNHSAIRNGEIVKLKGEIEKISTQNFLDDKYSLFLKTGEVITVSTQLSEEYSPIFKDFPFSLLHSSIAVIVQCEEERGFFRLISIEKPSIYTRIKLQNLKLDDYQKSLKNYKTLMQKHNFSVSAISLLNNKDYFINVIDKIKKAKNSIYIMQIQSDYFSKTSKLNLPPATNELNNALIKALKRNVKVNFLTDYRENERFRKEKYLFLKRLKYNGANIFLDDGRKTTHCKLLIIDEKQLIIGSTNWSLPAITLNNESSVCLTSAALARYYVKYFKRIVRDNW